MAKDYYQILGIVRSASPDEVKRAYRKLAHKYHPDKGGDEKRFKEINEAYQILSDKEKRNQYDKFGKVFEGASNGGQSSDYSWAWGRPGADFEFDMGDLGEVFEEIFGFRGAERGRDPKKGKNIEIDMEISLEDVLRGKERELSFYKMLSCSRCQGVGAEPNTSTKECFSCRGTGQVQQIRKTPFGSFTRSAVCPECKGEGFRPEKPCNVCRGEGRVNGKENIKVFIPAGIDTNQTIKVEGKGEAGRRGGRPGDLYIKIFVKRHPVFKRKGDDLYISLSISLSQAALGGEIEILTLEGTKILLKISPGTESGKILRISGKGISRFSGYGRGDMYVELTIKAPKRLSKKQKELLEQLREEGI